MVRKVSLQYKSLDKEYKTKTEVLLVKFQKFASLLSILITSLPSRAAESKLRDKEAYAICREKTESIFPPV